MKPLTVHLLRVLALAILAAVLFNCCGCRAASVPALRTAPAVPPMPAAIVRTGGEVLRESFRDSPDTGVRLEWSCPADNVVFSVLASASVIGPFVEIATQTNKNLELPADMASRFFQVHSVTNL